jgi:hypothetical protein
MLEEQLALGAVVYLWHLAQVFEEVVQNFHSDQYQLVRVVTEFLCGNRWNKTSRPSQQQFLSQNHKFMIKSCYLKKPSLVFTAYSVSGFFVQARGLLGRGCDF